VENPEIEDGTLIAGTFADGFGAESSKFGVSMVEKVVDPTPYPRIVDKLNIPLEIHQNPELLQILDVNSFIAAVGGIAILV